MLFVVLVLYYIAICTDLQIIYDVKCAYLVYFYSRSILDRRYRHDTTHKIFLFFTYKNVKILRFLGNYNRTN